ncbi:MAG: hypothetical protein QMD22_10310 [archaeon]|nr:hypothetical protein [archaeon]
MKREDAKRWGKEGARIRREGARRVIPIDQLLRERNLYGKEIICEWFERDECNVRKAHCKTCGAVLQAGEGRPFYILATDGYNRSR